VYLLFLRAAVSATCRALLSGSVCLSYYCVTSDVRANIKYIYRQIIAPASFYMTKTKSRPLIYIFIRLDGQQTAHSTQLENTIKHNEKPAYPVNNPVSPLNVFQAPYLASV